MAKHTKKRHYFKLITEYGIHIWAILIIANAALAYAFNFAANADNKNDSAIFSINESLQDVPEEEPQEDGDVTPTVHQRPTKSPRPLGPVIGLTFTVPGIGSGGGTLKPVHLTRDVTIFLFSTEVNSLNPTVRPLYTIQTTAEFDTNPDSPTYTSFLNPHIDLGSGIKEGTYQIAFRTSQSLRTLIREKPENIGGQKLKLTNNGSTLELLPQTVNMGDILPAEGDNVVDISDYNAFVNCFGSSQSSDFCQNRNFGDFDDNGTIDGIDYNIMLRSFANLLKQGQSVPELTVAPSIPDRVVPVSSATPTQGPAEPTEVPDGQTKQARQPSNAGPIIGGILFLLFIFILGGIGFYLYKKNEKVRNKIQAIIHMSPTGKPEINKDAASNATDQAQPTDTTAQAQTPDQASATPTETPAETAQTEQTPPVAETPPAEPPASPAQEEAPTAPAAETATPDATPQAEPTNATTPTDGAKVDKEAYVKVKGADEGGTGQWLLLTDDNGPMQAHYAKNDAKDGFAKVTGVMKTENGKTFLEVSELTIES